MKLEELRQLTDEQLVERFPFIKNRNRFTNEECEGVEIDRNDSWYDLELLICERIKQSYDNWDEKTKKDFMILDIKEKYGSLRFYVSFEDDNISRAISDAENLSFCICSNCGNLEKDESGKNAITYKERVFGGTIALCKTCAEKFQKYYNYKFEKVLEPFEYKITRFSSEGNKTTTYNSLELFNV